MLFADLVAVSADVGATRSRKTKTQLLAGLLSNLAIDEVEPAIGFLTGEVRQGRIGVGWATISKIEAQPAPTPTLRVADIDGEVERLVASTGPGSQQARAETLAALFGRATEAEQSFLGRLLVGELRQGALEGVMVEAIAAASGVAASKVRRAHMLGGSLVEVARRALDEGEAAVVDISLEIGRPLQPMLASTSDSVADAIATLGESSVEWKMDGIRVQAHRLGDEVSIYTRNLNDITHRLPEVTDVVRSLPAVDLVLDGEVLSVDESGTAVPFQDTMSSLGRDDANRRPDGATAVVHFFDLLHLDGHDLIDRPLAERRQALIEVVGRHSMPGEIVGPGDTDRAEAILAEALDAGHEGVMAKAVGSTYEAGRRGKWWQKVKPVYTLDLVVLAVERGHGRRTGTLSNLHLGARSDGDDDGPSFVMVGKTFKGLTDALLAWQTEALAALAVDDDGHTVTVRPELVVEIAIDGVQASTTYAGGAALRFARVRRYRDDKNPTDADTIDTVRSFIK